jgi:hypothetical protein
LCVGESGGEERRKGVGDSGGEVAGDFGEGFEDLGGMVVVGV